MPADPHLTVSVRKVASMLGFRHVTNILAAGCLPFLSK